ncbi:hypothetical protein HNR42_003470 [Deinobacterium chartae]|uniref:DUF3592 domain-containing protein n=1 Tax=Deinobacterium chartae TaxID=521158 RepID=A0A841I892_9DEIO|nr:hypothetical protein [Deinobacterium chartae]
MSYSFKIKNPRVAGWIFMLLGLACAAVLVWAFASATLTARWPTTTGTVVYSEIVEHVERDDDGDLEVMYEPRVTYTYAVEGTSRQGNRIGYMAASWSDRALAETVVQRYPLGQPVRVHYDPSRPEDALLEPGLSPLMWLWMLLPAAAVALGSWLARIPRVPLRTAVRY